MDELGEIRKWIIDLNSLRRAIISGRRKSLHPAFERIDLRPVLIREALYLQLVSHDGKKDETKNIKPEDFNLDELLNEGYANIRIERNSENIDIKITKKGKFRIHRETNKTNRELKSFRCLVQE